MLNVPSDVFLKKQITINKYLYYLNSVQTNFYITISIIHRIDKSLEICSSLRKISHLKESLSEALDTLDASNNLRKNKKGKISRMRLEPLKVLLQLRPNEKVR